MMIGATHHILGTCNYFAVLLLMATTVRAHDGCYVAAEDINKTITVYKNNASGSIGQRSSGDNGLVARPLEQGWHRSGSCPEGTIPIRRMIETTVNPNLTIIPELSVSSHGNIVIEDDSNSGRAEFAVAFGVRWPCHGASALLPSWRPTKLERHEYSLTSVAIAGTVDRRWICQHRSGDFPPDTTNQIAAGLMASTSFFRNNDPNLYVYYSNDGGKNHKCFNLLCPGFVQTNNKIALGTSFINGGSSITYDGVPYVTMSIHRVSGQRPWWVSVNDTVIGYFPHTLFPTFFPESFVNQVGGIVHNSRPGGVHTDTVMGNGRMPSSGNSAVVKAYSAIAADGADKKDKPFLLGVTAPKCYNVAVLGENQDVSGYDIAYGGPGGSHCDR